MSGKPIDEAVIEAGLRAAADASDARLPRYKAVRAIIEAALTAAQQHLAEIEDLRELCGMAYQLAGVHDAPEEWLDALSNAAAGRPFSTDVLLPYIPQASD